MNKQEELAKKLHAKDYDFQTWDQCGELRKGKYLILAKAMLAKEQRELVGKKVHTIWVKSTEDYRESEHVYKPWGYYTFDDNDYDYGRASYLTKQGHDVKLVTSIVTNVL